MAVRVGYTPAAEFPAHLRRGTCQVCESTEIGLITRTNERGESLAGVPTCDEHAEALLALVRTISGETGDDAFGDPEREADYRLGLIDDDCQVDECEGFGAFDCAICERTVCADHYDERTGACTPCIWDQAAASRLGREA